MITQFIYNYTCDIGAELKSKMAATVLWYSLFVSHYLFKSDERYRLLGASCLLCDIHTLYLFWILNCYLINSNTCLILDIPGIDKFKDV
jgi:hypothetical protein